MHQVDDLRIGEIQELLQPSELIQALPVSDKAADVVTAGRTGASEIIHGNDDRLLVVVGPCSIHDIDAALEYGKLLKAAADKHIDDLHIIMRVYFEKPRTTVGWKGLINDPDINETYDITRGLRLARKLLIDLADLGLPAGTEYLDTISPQFLADLVAWGAIGARTTESQVHRELASGLSMPVGFKNGTGGSAQIAVDAIRAAQHPHRFLSVTKDGTVAIVATKGNDDCHIILRGAKSGPNYDAQSVAEVEALLAAGGLDPSIMIDLSHGNSRKDYAQQPSVAAEVGAQIAAGSRSIRGVMIESHLVEGRQDWSDADSATHGQSITDSCLGWEATEGVLENLAQAIRERRDK